MDRGVDVVAVSTEPPDVSARLRARLGFDIRFCSDAQGTLMDVLNVRHRDGLPPAVITGMKQPASRDPSYLVDGAGVIRWIYRPDTYRVRAPAREVLQAIDTLEEEQSHATSHLERSRPGRE